MLLRRNPTRLTRLPVVVAGNSLELQDFQSLAARGDWVPFQWEGFSSVLVNHPDLVEETLLTRQKDFERSGGPPRLARLLGNGLLRSRGDRHLRQRRLTQPAFTPSQMESYSVIMREESERVCSSWSEGTRLNFHREMLHLTLSIATRAFFAADLGKRSIDTNAAISRLPTGTTAWREKIRSKVFEHKVGRLDRTLYELIDSPSPEGSLLSALKKGRELDRNELRDELMTLLVAGHETTASALAWSGHLLTRFPEWQSPRFARGVFAEALRLYPPAWILLRRAIRPTIIAGNKIAEGTIVVISPYLLGRDPRFFSDPLRCDPSRPREKGFYPFGLGTRRCLGEAFAWREGEVILSTVLERFRLTAVDRAVTEEPAFTLRPRNGINIQLHARESQRQKEKVAGNSRLGARDFSCLSDLNAQAGTDGSRPSA